MSSPTIIDPGLSSFNDPSVVETNDRNLALSATGLEIDFNVKEHKGVRVVSGAKYLVRDLNDLPQQFNRFVDDRTSDSFLFWKQTPTTQYSYVSVSAYGLSGGDYATQSPATITIQVQRNSAAAVSSGWSNVGSAITLSAASMETLSVVDLSGVSIDASKTYHRVQVIASEAGSSDDAYWGYYPCFVCVQVRTKQRSY